MRKNSFCIDAKIYASQVMLILSSFLYALTIFCVWYVSLNFQIKCMFTVFIIYYYIQYLYIHFLKKHNSSTYAIRMKNNQWMIQTNQGWQVASLDSNIWVTSYLVAFSLITHINERFETKHHIFLFCDSCDQYSMHSIRVYFLLQEKK